MSAFSFVLCFAGFLSIVSAQDVCYEYTDRVPNGRIITEGRTTRTWSRAQLVCDFGYEIVGDDYVTCEGNNRWSTLRGRCVRRGGGGGGGMAPAPSEHIECPAVPYVRNGRVEPGGSHIGDTRHLQCDPGFRLTEPRTFFCQNNGQWSPIGSCDLDRAPVPSGGYCSNVPGVTNGYLSEGCSTFGCKRTIHCNPGYCRRGYCRVYCRDSGRWDVDGSCEPCGRVPAPSPWNPRG